MIVIGVDTHMDTHTAVAVSEATGRMLGELTARARPEGFAEHLEWARSLAGDELTWAIEDCRHVSGQLEAFLVEQGQRVVRVVPSLMGRSRKGSRERGKSDRIDATNVARAAIQEGIDKLPKAYIDEESLEIKLLSDHRESLVEARTKDQQRLRSHLHCLPFEIEIPDRGLADLGTLERIRRRLSRSPDGVRVEVACDLIRSIRASVKKEKELETEIAKRVRRKSPSLLEISGCGTLTAAKILAETYGLSDLDSDAKLARLAGVAPIPASSGRTDRHRLDPGGNRQLNRAIHMIALYQGAHDERGRAFMAKKKAEGKTTREARRCLKRHIIRPVYQALKADRAALGG